MKKSKKLISLFLAVMMAVLSLAPFTAFAADNLTIEENKLEDSSYYNLYCCHGDDFVNFELQNVAKGKTMTVNAGEKITITMSDGSGYTTSTTSAHGNKLGWHYGTNSPSYCLSTDVAFTLTDGTHNFAVSGFGSKTNANNTYAQSGQSINTTFTLDGGIKEPGTYNFKLGYKFQMKKHSWGKWGTNKETNGVQYIENIAITVLCTHDFTDAEKNAKSNNDGTHTLTCTVAGCNNEEGKTKTVNCSPADALANVNPATCEAEGYSGDTVCKDCGYVITTGEKTPALGHTWIFNKDTKEVVCKNDASHKLNPDTDVYTALDNVYSNLDLTSFKDTTGIVDAKAEFDALSTTGVNSKVLGTQNYQEYMDNIIAGLLSEINIAQSGQEAESNINKYTVTLKVNGAVIDTQEYKRGNVMGSIDLSTYENAVVTIKTENAATAKPIKVSDLPGKTLSFFVQTNTVVDVTTVENATITVKDFYGIPFAMFSGTKDDIVISADNQLTIGGTAVDYKRSPSYTFTGWVVIEDEESGTITVQQKGTRVKCASEITAENGTVDGKATLNATSFNTYYTLTTSNEQNFIAWIKEVDGKQYVSSYNPTVGRFSSSEDKVVYKAITNIDEITDAQAKAIASSKKPSTYCSGYRKADDIYSVISGEFTISGYDTTKYNVYEVGVVVADATVANPVKGGSNGERFLNVNKYSADGTFTVSCKTDKAINARTYIAYTEVIGTSSVPVIEYGPVVTIEPNSAS